MDNVSRLLPQSSSELTFTRADVDDAARYLNRLSDLFFVMARTVGRDEESEWRGIEKPDA